MLLSLSLTLLAGLIAAVPLQPRALSTVDLAVLELAQYLELGSLGVMTQGCKDITPDDFANAGLSPILSTYVCSIARQDVTHVGVLNAFIVHGGGQPLPQCIYRDIHGTEPRSFVELAIGATSALIGFYLGALEASLPTAFDTGVSALWSFNLAQPYIFPCPVQPDLVRLPALNLSAALPALGQTPLPAGSELTFLWDPTTLLVQPPAGTPLYLAMITQYIATPIFVPVTQVSAGAGTITLPSGLQGAVFVCLTTFSGGLTMDDLSAYGTRAGPLELLLS